jgi:8-oxo-dGTP pyrophosphatase MutT (NUDIX family)
MEVIHPEWSPDDDLVRDLRHLLAHAPRNSAEARFEAWAWRALLDADGPVLLTRHARPSHVTASALVLSPDARRTCLVLHGRIGRWVQPGGHLEPADRTLTMAAAREVREETGLTGAVLPEIACLSRHLAPCAPDVDWHLDVQFVVVAEPKPPIVSSESQDVRWWDVDALPAGLAHGVEESLARALEVVGRRDQEAAGPPSTSSPAASSSGSIASTWRSSAAPSSPMRTSRAAANPSR